MTSFKEDREIASWQELSLLFKEYEPSQNWIFRGQTEWKWTLKTSLEKTAENLGIDFADLPKIEQGLLRKFKRHYYHFSSEMPLDDDYIEWLAIMQHHGSPTMMLDFTYSIYVALYFAVINSKIDQESAIWCIDSDWIHTKYRNTTKTKYNEEHGKDKTCRYLNLNKIILNDNIPFLYCISPFQMNPRLTIQQGTFLIPLDITRSFMDNLNATITHSSEASKICKMKLKPKAFFIKEIYYNLYRMNITSATLFHGLDGFAKHLKHLMYFPNMRHTAIDAFI